MKGSCLCGAVVYQVERLVPHTTHCHCSRCRKTHGAAFATYAVVPHDAFCWVAGEDKVTYFAPPGQAIRSFCSQCGTSLTFQSSNNSETIDIAAATLDDPLPLPPEAHIYTKFKAAWTSTEDQLPCYDEGHDLD